MPKKLNDINKSDDVNYVMYPARNSLPEDSFYQNMYKYKSVQHYLRSLKRKNKKRKSKARKKLLQAIASLDNNMDYSVDVAYNMPPIGNTSAVSEALVGGIVDHVTPGPDFWNHDIGTTLNYGVAKDNLKLPGNDRISQLFEELLAYEGDLPFTEEPPIYGMPDGIIPVSDKDHEYDSTGYDIQYGYPATDLGNLVYQNMALKS